MKLRQNECISRSHRSNQYSARYFLLAIECFLLFALLLSICCTSYGQNPETPVNRYRSAASAEPVDPYFAGFGQSLNTVPLLETEPTSETLSNSTAATASATTQTVASDNSVLDFNPWRTARQNHYFEADYLVWWAERSRLTPLLTTNVPGTPLADAGPLGSPGSSVLIGDQFVGDWAHSGLRLRYGKYFHNRRISRVEFSVWHMFQDTFRLFRDSNDSASTNSGVVPIFGRPFFNTAINQNDAQILSYPGLVDGNFQFKYNRQALGVDSLTFACLHSDACRWTEFYTGYRYIWLHDNLNTDEKIDAAAGGLLGPNFGYRVQDSFEASNGYHLIPIGLSTSGNRGKWLWNLRGDVGLGIVNQTVEVHGMTQVLDSGVVTDTYDAGLLALGTNSGRHERTKFAWVPQLSLNLQRRLTDRATAQFGYTLINLNDAVKAVDHIPTRIDPGNLPPAIPGSGPDPRFAFHDESLWIHGFNFGLRLNY